MVCPGTSIAIVLCSRVNLFENFTNLVLVSKSKFSHYDNVNLFMVLIFLA